MPVLRSEASNDDALRFLQGSLDTDAALSAALRLLRVREALTADPQESTQISISLLDLAASLAKLRAERLEFQSNQRAIDPPSAATIASIQAKARSIGAMTANTVLASDLIRAATDVITTFQGTR